MAGIARGQLGSALTQHTQPGLRLLSASLLGAVCTQVPYPSQTAWWETVPLQLWNACDVV